MNVLHLVSGDLDEGAARGAYWLHLGLRELGVSSNMLLNSSVPSNDPSIVLMLETEKDMFFGLIRRQAEISLTRLYPKRTRKSFSTGMFGVDFTRTDAYQAADILHLQWVNNAFVNLKHLRKVKKPIVWTIRDMWMVTGGCHVPQIFNCEQYQSGCGRCKLLRSSNKFDLSRLVYARKKRVLPKNIQLVGISRWMSKMLQGSPHLQDFSIRTISNNIHTHAFFPVEKVQAKDTLGINTHKKIVLTGAKDHKEPRKGFGEYLNALKILDKDKYHLCFFGVVDEDIIQNLGFEYTSLGYLHDDISMRLAYSAADVFAAPSLAEPFGKTLAEAMACNTPVVCFDATGPRDIVTHQIDGYRAEAFDPVDFARGIEWVLDYEDYEQLCKNARDKVMREFDHRVVAGQYQSLYRELLDKAG